MLDRYAINLDDSGLDDSYIDGHWRDGESPKEFVSWFGTKFDLTERREFWFRR
jgi:hypothetical protein